MKSKVEPLLTRHWNVIYQSSQATDQPRRIITVQSHVGDYLPGYSA